MPGRFAASGCLLSHSRPTRFRGASRGLGWTKKRLLVLGVLVLALSFVATAMAANYAQGSGGAGGLYSTPGYAPRSYNRVYHQPGYTWTVYYRHPDNSTAGVVTNTSNPTSYPAGDSYARSLCFNGNDNSGVQWTCQTS